MSSIRYERINQDVKRVLTELFRQLKDPRIHGLVTITRAEVSGDLKNAKVFVSVLGSEQDKKEVLAGLKSASGWLRRELGGSMNMRSTPELAFIQDRSIDEGSHILDLINKVSSDKSGEDS